VGRVVDHYWPPQSRAPTVCVQHPEITVNVLEDSWQHFRVSVDIHQK